MVRGSIHAAVSSARAGGAARLVTRQPAGNREGARLFSFAAPALSATEDCNPNRTLYAALFGADVAATCNPAAPKQCTPGADASKDPPSTDETIAAPPAESETTVEGTIIAVDPGAVSQARCSPDWEVRSHDELPPDWYTELPKAIKSAEMVCVRQLTSAHPETVSTDGNKGHARNARVLVRAKERARRGNGSNLQPPLSSAYLDKNKGGNQLPQTSKLVTHNKEAHADMYNYPPFLAGSSQPNGLERSLQKAKRQNTMMVAFGSSGAVGSSIGDAAPSLLSREDRQFAAQTQCLIYCKQVLSKQTLRDPYYVNMLQVQGTCRSCHADGSLGQPGAVLTIGGFFDRTRAEFAVFNVTSQRWSTTRWRRRAATPLGRYCMTAALWI